MRLKMLVGMSGGNFVLDPGEVTDRFDEKEANRLIATGFAEKAPPVEKKKPATKQEWDDERDALIAKNERLTAEALSSLEREAALVLELDKLNSFKDLVAGGMLELALEELPEQEQGSDEVTASQPKATGHSTVIGEPK